MRFILSTLALCIFLCGCSASGSKLGERSDLGAFKLGHNVVVTENATKGPFSRDATPEQLQSALMAEIDRRIRKNRKIALRQLKYEYPELAAQIDKAALDRKAARGGMDLLDFPLN